MKRKTNLPLLSLAFLLLIQFACINEDNQKLTIEKLTHTWQISSIDDSKLKSGNEKIDLAVSSALIKGFQNGATYAFFPDGQFAEARESDYFNGEWTISADGKIITFVRLGEKTYNFNVVAFDAKKKTLTLNNDEFPIDITFAQVEDLSDEKINPMHPNHNKWRKKATHHETDEELLARLENLVQHYIYLLTVSQERKDKVISFAQSQSIIKIYSGGIGVLPEESVPPVWKYIFFDKENEQRIYQLFEQKLLEGGDLNIKSTGSWVKDDIMVLKAIYANFSHTLK